MICLAIETSCDDTSVAILQFDDHSIFEDILNSTKILSSVVSSQVKTHALYGGVIPEIGARLHTTNFQPVMLEAITQAINQLKITTEEFWKDLNLIAVTNEPGLNSALKVGIEEAKAIKHFLKKNYDNNVALIKVNHLKGHIASSFLESESKIDNPFPHLHLLVSGGNTQILHLNSWSDSKIVGKTVDDAVGECYDKTSRMLGFKYPGGVGLARTAGLEAGNYINLNKAMLNESLNTSFSGLKTQVRYITQGVEIEGFEYEKYLNEKEIEELRISKIEELSPKLKFVKESCISIQTVCTEQLKRKLKSALSKYESKTIGLSGGVSANLHLREELTKLEKQLYKPLLKYTGDNAAMIGMAGVLDYMEKIRK
ncbi:MAG: tRNA (adenosine(37)-N6)-threonylcarbamoyltransferase complex transferase subunit TsaD [Patescibacteria group bacterium]